LLIIFMDAHRGLGANKKPPAAPGARRRKTGSP
jgi:hypothetical protein